MHIVHRTRCHSRGQRHSAQYIAIGPLGCLSFWNQENLQIIETKSLKKLGEQIFSKKLILQQAHRLHVLNHIQLKKKFDTA